MWFFCVVVSTSLFSSAASANPTFPHTHSATDTPARVALQLGVVEVDSCSQLAALRTARASKFHTNDSPRVRIRLSMRRFLQHVSSLSTGSTKVLQTELQKDKTVFSRVSYTLHMHDSALACSEIIDQFVLEGAAVVVHDHMCSSLDRASCARMRGCVLLDGWPWLRSTCRADPSANEKSGARVSTHVESDGILTIGPAVIDNGPELSLGSLLGDNTFQTLLAGAVLAFLWLLFQAKRDIVLADASGVKQSAEAVPELLIIIKRVDEMEKRVTGRLRDIDDAITKILAALKEQEESSAEDSGDGS